MLLYQKKRKKSRGPSKTIRFRNTDIRTVFEIIQMILLMCDKEVIEV